MKIWPFILIALLLLSAALFGGLLGKGLAQTINTINTENFTEFETALPTKLLDINGEVITELASSENRELIAFQHLPQQVIDALLTREDRIFYDHPGFSMKALFRAVIGVATHKSLGGGSTLSQQIAGTLYCDRREKSVNRKLKELWWAIQMERRYSKDEILELYLNKIYFGGGTYGVNAACKYYFGHDATDVSYAEAALLVIQLSNPAYMNPFDYPNRAQDRQKSVLDNMVDAGYITKEEAEYQFDEYWGNFDYNRTNASAYTMRSDKAPWFSEYVTRQLKGMMYGNEDIYSDGFTVNTTLNLSHQAAADEIMADYLAYGNDVYKSGLSDSRRAYFATYVPFTELATLVFNLPGLKVSDERVKVLSENEFVSDVNPVMDIVAMMSGIESLKTEFVSKGNELGRKKNETATVEATMVSVENSTGYINAIVGGSKYDAANQFIRAVQAKIQPGSSFKPLYYSAAIDARTITTTTIISDTPQVFINGDGTPYVPQNYAGGWHGDVLVNNALALSLNIPALKVLQSIGFDAAIERSTALLGIPVEEYQARAFEPVYALGLGICSVSPLELCKAFATFANNGKEVIPISIRTVLDKNGNIIANPEKDIKNTEAANGGKKQIVSVQNAYIMQEMLKKTVTAGTLFNGSRWDSTLKKIHKDKGTGSKFKFYNTNGDAFMMPVAGKTGTTQNWADAWAVGFTPYYTSVFWFGFDRPGQSLGLSLTGSSIAAPAWGDFMHEIHIGKSYKPFFDKTPSNITSATVCKKTGDLWTKECGNDMKYVGVYYSGTEPQNSCTFHKYNSSESHSTYTLQLEQIYTGFGWNGFINDSPLTADLDFLNEDSYVSTSDNPEDQFKNLFGIDESNENSSSAGSLETDSSDDEDEDLGNWFLQ